MQLKFQHKTYENKSTQTSFTTLLKIFLTSSPWVKNIKETSNNWMGLFFFEVLISYNLVICISVTVLPNRICACLNVSVHPHMHAGQMSECINAHENLIHRGWSREVNHGTLNITLYFWCTIRELIQCLNLKSDEFSFTIIWKLRWIKGGV